MTYIRTALVSGYLALVSVGAAHAGDIAIDSFDPPQQNRWEFFADRVMGGFSEGSLSFLTEG